MAQLLVSVRSATEAKVALDAGAALIDVKEPDQGSLGQAPFATWREVHEVVRPSVPVSVALGELHEWASPARARIPSGAWEGMAFRKIGLAGSGPDWKARWAELRAAQDFVSGPPWIAVAYADWGLAGAPDPNAVLEAARGEPSIVGVLVDTWSKARPFQPREDWTAWAARVRAAGLILAVAGGLALPTIGLLDRLAPDVVAVRGAACEGGRRQGTIDLDKVAELARRVAALPSLLAEGSEHRLQAIRPGYSLFPGRTQSATSNLTPWASGSVEP